MKVFKVIRQRRVSPSLYGVRAEERIIVIMDDGSTMLDDDHYYWTDLGNIPNSAISDFMRNVSEIPSSHHQDSEQHK